MPKTYDRVFTQEDYLNLHQQVLAYQAGTPGAADYIVTEFHEFLSKYENLISYGKFDIEYICARRFLSLFMDNKPMRKNLSQYRFSPTIRRYIYETGAYVNRMIMKNCPKEDVYQILVLTLLEMAKRYKDYEKPSFHNYVDKCFHFHAFMAFKRYFTDPSDRLRSESNGSRPSFDRNEMKDICELLEDNGALSAYDKTMNEVDHAMRLELTNDFVINENGVSVYDDQCLNLNWINGATCTEAFKELSPFERKILILAYIENKPDREIANEFGLCRAAINRKRRGAVKKLQDTLESEV